MTPLDTASIEMLALFFLFCFNQYHTLTQLVGVVGAVRRRWCTQLNCENGMPANLG